jgi:hypothetical protein
MTDKAHEMSEGQIRRERAEAAHSSGHEPPPDGAVPVPDGSLPKTGTTRPQDDPPPAAPLTEFSKGATTPADVAAAKAESDAAARRATQTSGARDSNHPDGLRRPDGSYVPFGTREHESKASGRAKYDDRVKEGVKQVITALQMQTSNLHDLIDHIDNHGTVTRNQIDHVKGKIEDVIRGLSEASGVPS